MGRQQRIFEARGRLAHVHVGYQVNQGRQRLQESIERDPENRERYEKELEWLNESYREQMKDFERLDLDDLLGGKVRDKGDDRKEKKDEKEHGEQEREDGKDRRAEIDESRTGQEVQDTAVTTDESKEPPGTTEKPDKEHEDKEDKERERDRDDEGRGR